jgi:hypothetical protein
MTMITSLFRQLQGLDDDDNKPVWPTWAVGFLFRGARRVHVTRIFSHNSPVIGESEYPRSSIRL